ncbi:MAG TPA: metallopeptidase TldD-related protein [Mycobacteriales bacterium]|nr:metallopeptidase TldD-related protein [Mycobacteriales bacterium]
MTPQETVERVIAAAGRTEVVALVRESSSANLRWANNTLTTNGEAETRSVTVARVVGGSVGVVSRTGLSAGDIPDLIAAAEAAARSNPPAEDVAPLVAGDAGDGWDDPPATTSTAALHPLLADLSPRLRAAAAAHRVLYGFAEHDVTTTYLGTSTGIRRRHAQPTATVGLTGRSVDGSRSAWSGAAHQDPEAIELTSLDADVTRRLSWAARQVELPAGRYDTLLPPSAMADLMAYAYWTASGLEADQGRTVYSRPGGGTRVGERLSSLDLTLRSDPGLPTVGCAPFVAAESSSSMSSVFDNGLPVRPTAWIDGGTLTALVHTRRSAETAGAPPTPFVDNLVLEGPPGGPDLDAMVAATQRGLLLTALWYIRVVDPQTLLLTGLTRDGVFLVEDGEVVAAVNNFRFNESPVDLLGRLAAVGPTQPTLGREFGDVFPRTLMPAVRVPDFHMSSVSQAN